MVQPHHQLPGPLPSPCPGPWQTAQDRCKQPRTDASKHLPPHPKGHSLGTQGWETQTPAACPWENEGTGTSLWPYGGFVRLLSCEQSNNAQIRALPGKSPGEALGRDGLSVVPWVTPLRNLMFLSSACVWRKKSECMLSWYPCALFQGFPRGPCDVTSFRTPVREEEGGLQRLNKAAGLIPTSLLSPQSPSSPPLPKTRDSLSTRKQ